MSRGLTALVPQPVIDFQLGDDPLAMPLPIDETTEAALKRVYGAFPPLSGAVWDFLVMGPRRSYTGLAIQLAVTTSTH